MFVSNNKLYSAKKPREVIGTSAAARKFGVTTDTIRKWVAQGKLPADQTVTGRLRFDVQVIEQLKTRQ